jgi:hypothetical protein
VWRWKAKEQEQEQEKEQEQDLEEDSQVEFFSRIHNDKEAWLVYQCSIVCSYKAGMAQGKQVEFNKSLPLEEPSLVKPGILSAFLALGIFLILFNGTNKEVAENWPKYRCQPHIMPLAGYYGYNAQENIEFCLKNVFLKEAPAVLGPIYEVTNTLNQTMSAVGTGIMSIRQNMSSLVSGIQGVFRSFNKRIQVVLQVLKDKFNTLENLMGRLFALFITIMYTGITALAAGSTFAKGTVFAFLETFCFPAGTPIRCADGSWKPIESISVNDQLWTFETEKNIVKSTFIFDGRNTSMCSVDDVTISTNHLVLFEGNWIPAGNHCRAIPLLEKYEKLYCLSTSLHRFWAGSILVSDFEESEEASSLAQRAIMRSVNGVSQENENEKAENYNLGLDPNLEVATIDGWIPLTEIVLGTLLVGGGKIYGLVDEMVEEVSVNSDSLKTTSAQLFWDCDGKKWRRNVNHNSITIPGKTTLKQLFVGNNNIFYVRDPKKRNGRTYAVRDYNEVSDCSQDVEAIFLSMLKIE